MAADTRRQLPLLIGLLVLLAAVAWWQFGGAAPAARDGRCRRPTAAPTARPGRRAARRRRRRHRCSPAAWDSSGSPRTGPRPRRRAATLPVRSRRREAPHRPRPRSRRRAAAADAGQPPGRHHRRRGPPPITVKFIGVVSRRDVGKVAILSDGKNVYYGRAGRDRRWTVAYRVHRRGIAANRVRRRAWTANGPVDRLIGEQNG